MSRKIASERLRASCKAKSESPWMQGAPRHEGFHHADLCGYKAQNPPRLPLSCMAWRVLSSVVLIPRSRFPVRSEFAVPVLVPWGKHEYTSWRNHHLGKGALVEGVAGHAVENSFKRVPYFVKQVNTHIQVGRA